MVIDYCKQFIKRHCPRGRSWKAWKHVIAWEDERAQYTDAELV